MQWLDAPFIVRGPAVCAVAVARLWADFSVDPTLTKRVCQVSERADCESAQSLARTILLNIIIGRFKHDLIMNFMDGVHAVVRMSNRPEKKNDTVVPSITTITTNIH